MAFAAPRMNSYIELFIPKGGNTQYKHPHTNMCIDTLFIVSNAFGCTVQA